MKTAEEYLIEQLGETWHRFAAMDIADCMQEYADQTNSELLNENEKLKLQHLDDMLERDVLIEEKDNMFKTLNAIDNELTLENNDLKQLCAMNDSIIGNLESKLSELNARRAE